MPVTLDATVGGATSNSYCTQAEANTYFLSRLPLTPAWEDADDPTAALAMATRILENFGKALRILVPTSGNVSAYYVRQRMWTGAPATTTQKLTWPRSGMYDNNGNLIPSNVIPLELKEAEAEFAGQLLKIDRTLDNDVILQGLTSIRAGSVSLSFKSQFFKQVVPDAVLELLIPSWLTDELFEPAIMADFEVLSRTSSRRP